MIQVNWFGSLVFGVLFLVGLGEIKAELLRRAKMGPGFGTLQLGELNRGFQETSKAKGYTFVEMTRRSLDKDQRRR